MIPAIRHHFLFSGRLASDKGEVCSQRTGSGLCLMPREDSSHFPIVAPKQQESYIAVRSITVPICMAGRCREEPYLAETAEYLMPQLVEGGYRYLLVCRQHASDWWGGADLDGIPVTYRLQTISPISKDADYIGLGKD